MITIVIMIQFVRSAAIAAININIFQGATQYTQYIETTIRKISMPAYIAAIIFLKIK